MENTPAATKDSSNLAKWLTKGLVVTAMAGVTKLGWVPVVIAGLLAWGLGSHLVKLIERNIKSNAARTIIGITSVAVIFYLSLMVGLLVPKMKPVTPQVASQPAQSAQPDNPINVVTLEMLEHLAQEQNKNTPVKTSPSVEFTHVSAGPGLMLTYRMRVLVEMSFTEADLNGIRLDTLQEKCKDFKPGLLAGVTYVIEFHNLDGSGLLSVPITMQECEGLN